jgi:hypothetical protein
MGPEDQGAGNDKSIAATAEFRRNRSQAIIEESWPKYLNQRILSSKNSSQEF